MFFGSQIIQLQVYTVPLSIINSDNKGKLFVGEQLKQGNIKSRKIR